jgi:hypothetical protein
MFSNIAGQGEPTIFTPAPPLLQHLSTCPSVQANRFLDSMPQSKNLLEAINPTVVADFQSKLRLKSFTMVWLQFLKI